MFVRLTHWLLASLLLIALPAHAASEQSLEDLHQFRLNAQKSLTAFFMLTVMEGDQRYEKLLDQARSQADSELKALNGLQGAVSKSLHQQLEQMWGAYQQELLTLLRTTKEQGYTDLQPVADMAQHNDQLLNTAAELYKKIQEEDKISVRPLVQQSRDLAMLMQKIALDYASRGASIGGSFIGAGEQVALDEQAKRFEEQLKQLQDAASGNAEGRATLHQTEVKWRYIEKSVKNYNDNTVPFLISKYSDQIIGTLETASNQFAKGN